MEKKRNGFPVCPRIYTVAAGAAKEVSERMGSIKSIVLGKRKKHPNVKGMFALVSKLYQKSDEIDMLLKRSQLLEKEATFNPWLAKILLVELLWGKKRLPGHSRPETTIQAYEQIFKAHLSDTALEDPPSNSDVRKPRYVRINTLKWNQNDAIDTFRDEGWVLNKFLDKNDYNGFLEKIATLNEQEFMIDIHIPNLLVFPSKTTFYDHEAYNNGSMILQDKASCFPVHVLNPPPGSIVLDMCAAPGMKTTHLSAVMNNTGTVYATERDPLRFETLLTILEGAGATCVKAFNRDVLTCFDKDFPGVEYILVDPSCSGTGMTEVPVANQITQARVSSLSGFQIKILRHALTKFPNAKRVIYSTCSVLAEENEDVVRQVLETNFNFKLVPAKQYIGDSWFNTGSQDYGDIGKYCLYAKPNEDHTNGFFVAIFERLQDGETNQFFNTRVFNYKRDMQIKKREISRELKRMNKRKKDEGVKKENSEINEGKHTKRNDDCDESEGNFVPKKMKKLKNDEALNNATDTENFKVQYKCENIKKEKSIKNERFEDEMILEENNISKDTEKKKKHKSKKKSSPPPEDEQNLSKNTVKAEFSEHKKAAKNKLKHNLQEISHENVGDNKGRKEKISNEVNETHDQDTNLECVDITSEKTKKKKKKHKSNDNELEGNQEINIDCVNNVSEEPEKKKKKPKSKRNLSAPLEEENLSTAIEPHNEKKVKKNKLKHNLQEISHENVGDNKGRKEKISNEVNETQDQDTNLECVDITSEKTKKKKKKHKLNDNELEGNQEINIDCVNNVSEEPEKKKKKHKSKRNLSAPLEEENLSTAIEPHNEKKVKKNKSKHNLQEVNDESKYEININSVPEKAKKKKKSNNLEVNIENNVDTNLVSKKRKKKKREESEIYCEQPEESVVENVKTKKK